MTWKTFVIPLFLFIILLSPSLVFAGLPIDIEIINEVMIRNCGDISCGNQAGDINCFVACAGQAGTSQVYRFNAGLGGKQSCGLVATVPNPQSVAWINNTFFWTHSGQINTQINFTDCSVTDTTPPVINNNVYGMSFDLTNRWIAMADLQNDIIDENGSQIRTSYWGTATDLSYPNNTDNNTIWKGESLLVEYLNAGVTGESVNVNATWLITSVTGVDIVYVNSTTTWLYILAGGGSTTTWNLYRVNFSQGEISNPATFSGYNPADATTVGVGDRCLRLSMTTNLNGTLQWFVNATNVFNETVISSPLTDQAFEYCTTFDEGYFVWFVRYLDSASDEWGSLVQTVGVQETGIIPFIAEGFANLFGLDNQEQGKGLLAIILTLLMSVGISKKFSEHQGVIFLGSAVILLIAFWWVGWLPAWLGLLLIIFVASLFASVVKEIFMG